MATVRVNDLVNKAKTILQDTTSTRWPNEELIWWLNDSYREIILARPDANSDTGTFSCASGTRQDLDKSVGGFPTSLRLLDVVRNVASGSKKRAVRLIDRSILDDQRREWHNEAPAIDIEHFMFDERLPRSFLVYPPATSGAQLEVVFSSVPAEHNTASVPANETIRIVDSYANAMLDYILYRAYSKDAEYAANAARAAAHYNAMVTALGTNAQVTTATGPRDTEYDSRISRRPAGP